MGSMFSKLTLASVAVALVAIGLVAYLTNVTTANEFGVYYQHMSGQLEGGVASGFGGMGMGSAMMQRMMGTIGQPEREFLQAVNRSMWVAGAIAVVIAMLLSLLLARQITLPLRGLTLAARRIASGDLSQTVPVKSRDELGELATAFNSMAESLARNEQLRRNMVADIAHELRTPLTIIQGNLEAILDGVTPPTMETVTSIHEETTVLARLVADLRELSLAEAGQLKLQRGPTDLAALLGRAATRHQAAASEKGIALVTRLTEGLPPADVDEQRISQVVDNLLSNALRHTGVGGEIAVAMAQDAARGLATTDKHATTAPSITVSVKDTGSGIPADELSYVFERFYRLDKSRSRASGGSGIGLAIVKQLVEAHGGRAWAESAPGDGATFFFTVPAAR